MEKYFRRSLGRVYACIDLKSFYASVACVERDLDPMTTDLVVADESRGKGTICLAVTPSLKAKGVKNRCRLYEIPEDWDIIIARPQMRLYMAYSAAIYDIYLDYIDSADIVPYSIDECFFDFTPYLNYYDKTPKQLAVMLMDAVLEKKGIQATAGIGTNLFLAKVALDITAKHVPDHIGYLDESLFQQQLWHHMPLTDIWNIGPGTVRRLKKYGIYDLFGVAHCPESIIYNEFGKNGLYLIDHAWGRESCTIEEIKSYQPKQHSLSSSQILFEDYTYKEAKLILNEMVEALADQLIDHHLMAGEIYLHVGYSRNTGMRGTGGSVKLPVKSQSFRFMLTFFENIYEQRVYRAIPIRRIGIAFGDLSPEAGMQISCFDAMMQPEIHRDFELQKAVAGLRRRYGKTAVFRGIDQLEKATALERARFVGGHLG